MFPNVPFDGLSWPITQHAGVLCETNIEGLLEACSLCKGKDVDAKLINDYIVEKGILTANFRSDSKQIDAWRDYQQLLSEFGLIYSTRIAKTLMLTPVASAFMNKTITYREMITLQALRYQYPNGHKSQLNSSLLQSIGDGADVSSFTELQARYNILLRPAVLIWEIMNGLWQRGNLAVLTIDELQRYAVRCLRHTDTDACVDAIIEARNGGDALDPLPRARRNMADWVKILSQTLLFNTNSEMDTLAMASYSIKYSKAVKNVCDLLSNEDSFWIYSGDNYKQSWFEFYGNYDDNIQYVLKER